MMRSDGTIHENHDVTITAALADPREERDDSWQMKVEKAKQARATALETRKGKPAAFRTNLSSMPASR